jgi:hypothetical protein
MIFPVSFSARFVQFSLQVLSSNFDVGDSKVQNPKLFCGWTPGPGGWTAINGHLPPLSPSLYSLSHPLHFSGYGPNWTYAVGQFKVYSDWPLVCTYKCVIRTARVNSSSLLLFACSSL